MKKNRFLRWMLSALMAFSFIACQNEPLEGNFITDDGSNAGDFTATVNGEAFDATITSGQLNDGVLLLSGQDSSGNLIVLTISNVGECTFDLSLFSAFGSFIKVSDPGNGFVSSALLGGGGTATISAYDAENQTVTGTFSFVAVREVDDGSGGTTTETVVITEGVFNAIDFDVLSGSVQPNDCTIDDDTILNDPDDSFFANVDGTEFVDIEFAAEEILLGTEPLIKVTAVDSNGGQIQFFIPPNLGIGTFAFEPILNGAVLTGSYMAGDGSGTLTTGSGSITFTEFGFYTGKLAAQFSFTASDPLNNDPTIVEITEGEFNVDYLPSSGAVENSFSAFLDGVEYIPTSITIQQSPFEGMTLVNLTTENADTNQSISLVFPIDIVAGDHEMAPFTVEGTESVGIVNPDIGNTPVLYKSNPGTLTITSYEYSTGVIEGVFTFTANDPLSNFPEVYQVTQGQFVIKI
ncbi:MAG: DUF6252 family protein [Flavobacteriaceae bacterium]